PPARENYSPQVRNHRFQFQTRNGLFSSDSQFAKSVQSTGGYRPPFLIPETPSSSQPHARQTAFPSPQCASAIQIVCPLQSTADIQPQLQPALLRLSAMISQ